MPPTPLCSTGYCIFVCLHLTEDTLEVISVADDVILDTSKEIVISVRERRK